MRKRIKKIVPACWASATAHMHRDKFKVGPIGPELWIPVIDEPDDLSAAAYDYILALPPEPVRCNIVDVGDLPCWTRVFREYPTDLIM